MALTSYEASTLTASVINANFEEEIAALAAARARRCVRNIPMHFLGVDDGSALSVLLRSQEFIPPDDVRLLAVGIAAPSNAGPDDITATLTCPGNDHFLLGKTWSWTLDGSVNAYFYREDYSNETQENQLVLKKGVSYRITVANSDATAIAQVNVVLSCEAKMRRR